MQLLDLRKREEKLQNTPERRSKTPSRSRSKKAARSKSGGHPNVHKRLYGDAGNVNYNIFFPKTIITKSVSKTTRPQSAPRPQSQSAPRPQSAPAHVRALEPISPNNEEFPESDETESNETDMVLQRHSENASRGSEEDEDTEHLGQIIPKKRNVLPGNGRETPSPSTRLSAFMIESMKQSQFKVDPAVQKKSMKELSRPRSPVKKVVTDGVSKSSIEWLEYRARQTPGPGEYNVHSRHQQLQLAGKFNESRPKSDIEWKMLRAKAVPGPGEYDTKGHADRERSRAGSRFSGSRPKSDIDWKIYHAKQIPGPGEYISPATTGNHGPSGGRFSKATPKSDVEWKCIAASKVPGPGAYGKMNAGLPPPSGGRFSVAKPKSELDWQIHRASQTPGPGEYISQSENTTFNMPGQRFSTARPKSDLDWKIHHAKNLPGPGAYTISSIRDGPTGKFPFVYRPQDESLKHLAK